MQIDAAVARADQAGFSIEKVTLDAPRPDEILVRIAAVGLCHTDLFAKAGGIIPLPAILGHEGSGVVEAVGADIVKVRPGDRVGLTFRSCGQCPNCVAGQAAYCHYLPALNYAGTRIDGTRTLTSGDEPLSSSFFAQSAFATYALAYERNVIPLPDAMPLELAGPLGCGIQTGAGAIMRSLACEAGSSLVIFGAGSVGLAAVMGAAIQACGAVIVVERHAARRDLALELGATHVIDPDAGDVAAAVRAILPTGSAYALDTTGRPEVQTIGVACLAPRGVLGLVGIAPAGSPPPGEANMLLTFGHTIRGINEGDSNPDTFIPELIALHLEGRLPFDRLVRTYPFAAINDAVRDQLAGDCIKPILLMGDAGETHGRP
jgi:aryl-alcohol dehydrogenase